MLVEGVQRAKVTGFIETEECFAASAELIADSVNDIEIQALMRTVFAQFDQYVKLNKKIPPEILTSLAAIDDAGRLADTIAAHLTLKLDEKQKVLEMFSVSERLEHLLRLMEGEIDILQVEKRIRGRVKRQMEKTQREYYLNEQVKAIQKELGEQDENAEMDELEMCIRDSDMSANLVVAQMLFLEAENPDKDISLYINSPGGSVTAGMSIYDTMQFIKADVSTLCVGQAASMGAFLLAAGAKGKRFSLPNSRVMIHQPSGGFQGPVSYTHLDVYKRQVI